MSEADERLPVGPRGVQGKQGERGERGLSWRVRWSIVVLFVLPFGLGAGNLYWTAHQVNASAAAQKQQQAAQVAQVRKLETAVLASCAFAADVGSVPLPAVPKPSKLGVSLIADSRLQWRELGCPGRLAPPDPGFTRWARYYGLPAN